QAFLPCAIAYILPVISPGNPPKPLAETVGRRALRAPLRHGVSAVPLFSVTMPATKTIFIIQVFQVLKSQKPFVIDFHAQRCRSCKIMGPRLVLMAKVGFDEDAVLSCFHVYLAYPVLGTSGLSSTFRGILPRGKENRFLRVLLPSPYTYIATI
uniref:Thioredoxin domain-containing protein n=1 Tax=Salvator merianae TaxID=96440 RepID=A0A8D0DYR3_SALMN